MDRRRRLGQVDLNLLFTLHEVARLGSVTAAAHALGRTQPAISTRLRQLESQLGVTLFERGGPLLRLSPVGRAVLEEVGLVVAQLGAVLDRTRAMDKEPVGTVRVGALPTLCAYLLAPVAVRVTRAHPRTRVRLLPGVTTSQIDALRGGEIDVLVSVGLIRDSSLSVSVIGEIDACLVTPSSARMPRGALTVRQLDSFEWVTYGKIGDPFFDAVWSFLERKDLVRRVRLEVANIQAIKQLVLEGGGISILPRYTIVESSLQARELRDLDVRLPLCVAVRPRGEQAPVVGELLRELAAGVQAQRAPARSARRAATAAIKRVARH